MRQYPKNGTETPSRAEQDFEQLENFAFNPHIVQLRGLFENEKNHFLAMEFLVGGNLQTFIEQRKELERPLTEPQIQRIYHHMLQATNSLHVMGLIHRDLRPSKFLLTSHDPNDLEVKLGCVGISAGECIQRVKESRQT